MTWLGQVPVMALFLALLILPGWAGARLLGLRGLPAVGVGPALTAAVLGVGAIVIDLTHLALWSTASIAVMLLLALVVAGITGWMLNKTRPKRQLQQLLQACRSRKWRQLHQLLAMPKWQHCPEPLGKRISWVLATSLAITGFLQTLPMWLSTKVTNPAQTWDCTYHLNAAWVVSQTHNASSLGGLSPMYGEVATGMYYPAVWHSLVAVVGGPFQVVATSNCLAVVVGWLWLLGITALVRVLLPGRVSYTLLAPWVALLFNTFPTNLLASYVLWPNALSLALTPGVLAVLVLWWRGIRICTWHDQVLRAIVGGAAVLGASVVHPSAIFTIAALLLPAAGVHLWRLLRAQWRAGRQKQVTASLAAGALLLIVAAAFLALDPRAQNTFSFHRAAMGNWGQGLLRAVSMYASFPVSPGLVAAAVIVPALILGGSWLIVRRPTWPRWLVGSWLLAVLLATVAYGPPNPVRALSAPWYTDPNRISAFGTIPAVVLAVIAVEQLAATLLRKYGHILPQKRRSMSTVLIVVGLLLVAVTGNYSQYSRQAAYARIYDPGSLGTSGQASQAELAMAESLPRLVPAGAKILGDPTAGAAYVQVIGQRQAVYPQLSMRADRNLDIRWLAGNFKKIHREPKVCRVLKENGIDYFYADGDSAYYQTLRSQRAPGLYNVDLSQGFELVAEGGTAAVYRITACE